MDVDGAAEGGLTQDDFEIGSSPVLSPVVEEFQLTVTEELEALHIDGLAVIFGVVDMVGARAHFGNGALRAGFELTVFKDGEGNAGVGQVGEVNTDSAFDGLWINRIGEVPGLLALDHVDILGGVEISTAGAGLGGGFNAFFTPEVRLADVVVVGDGNGGAVAHDVAELHAELKPAGGVLGVVIGLVSSEEEEVGILFDEVLEDQRAWAGGAGGIAGEIADDEDVFVGGFAADLAFKGGLVSVAEAVGGIDLGVPVVNAEVGGPAGVDDFFFGDLLPIIAVFDFKADFLDLVGLEGEELGAHFESAVVKSVNRESDNFLSWDIEIDHGLLFGRALTFPPIRGGPIIKAGVFLAEELRGSRHEFSEGG